MDAAEVWARMQSKQGDRAARAAPSSGPAAGGTHDTTSSGPSRSAPNGLAVGDGTTGPRPLWHRVGAFGLVAYAALLAWNALASGLFLLAMATDQAVVRLAGGIAQPVPGLEGALLGEAVLGLLAAAWLAIELVLAARSILGLSDTPMRAGWIVLAAAATSLMAAHPSVVTVAPTTIGLAQFLALLAPLVAAAGAAVVLTPSMRSRLRAWTPQALVAAGATLALGALVASRLQAASGDALAGLGAFDGSLVQAAATTVAALAWLMHAAQAHSAARRLSVAALLGTAGLFATSFLVWLLAPSASGVLELFGQPALFTVLTGLGSLLLGASAVAALAVASVLAAMRASTDLAQPRRLRLGALAGLTAAALALATVLGTVGLAILFEPGPALEAFQAAWTDPLAVANLTVLALLLAATLVPALIANGSLLRPLRDHAATLGIASGVGFTLGAIAWMARANSLAASGPQQDFASATGVGVGLSSLVLLAAFPALVLLLGRTRGVPATTGTEETGRDADATVQGTGVIIVPHGADAANAQGLPSDKDWEFTPGPAA